MLSRDMDTLYGCEIDSRNWKFNVFYHMAMVRLRVVIVMVRVVMVTIRVRVVMVRLRVVMVMIRVVMVRVVMVMVVMVMIRVRVVMVRVRGENVTISIFHHSPLGRGGQCTCDCFQPCVAHSRRYKYKLKCGDKKCIFSSAV